jgi:integrase
MYFTDDFFDARKHGPVDHIMHLGRHKSPTRNRLILGGPAELRSVARAHVIAWRKDLEARGLSPASIRRKFSALSSVFDYLCERNAVSGNPVDGVKRPMANGNEGSTPALGDAQARKLLEAPAADTLKGVRDRASWPPCSVTAAAARSCAACGCATCRAVRTWYIFGLGASAAKSGSFRCMRWRRG